MLSEFTVQLQKEPTCLNAANATQTWVVPVADVCDQGIRRGPHMLALKRQHLLQEALRAQQRLKLDHNFRLSIPLCNYETAWCMNRVDIGSLVLGRQQCPLSWQCSIIKGDA